MSKFVTTLLSAGFLVGFIGLAFADEAKPIVDQPATDQADEMTDEEMDTATAGFPAGGADFTRRIDFGSYDLVYSNGVWSVVWD